MLQTHCVKKQFYNEEIDIKTQVIHPGEIEGVKIFD